MKAASNISHMSKTDELLLDQVQVIITTRNRIQELKFTIDHCLKLGLEIGQIMITDDASTDATSIILKQTYPGLTIYTNTTPLGYIYNRNAMMKNSDRDYILSLDDDSNLLSISDLTKALTILESDKTHAVFSFGVIEQKSFPKPKPLSHDFIFCKNFIGCGHIIKRSLLERVGYFREELYFYGEEIDFSIRCFQAGLKTVAVQGMFVHHRVDISEREKQFKVNISKGEYNVIWRSSYSISNTLLKIIMYYPIWVLPFYLIKSIFGQFYFYHFHRKQSKSYWLGLSRWLKMLPFGLKERTPFSLKEFRNWNRLPLYYSYY